MKSLMLFFVLVNLMALFITLSATTSNNEQFLNEDDETQEAISLRGTSRFLAQKNARVVMTCDKYPRVCRAKGSPGRDCCKKKCVNLLTDRLNCGKCGKKCKYSEICCKGECVNPRSNKKHCGSCGNKCKKGNVCVYGMCSYA
nr:stigma-specific STIG1-like protein 3 [Quercus suber]XP_023923034.1 stigma-specific STIG1-like protein 3 [Quercus suber]